MLPTDGFLPMLVLNLGRERTADADEEVCHEVRRKRPVPRGRKLLLPPLFSSITEATPKIKVFGVENITAEGEGKWVGRPRFLRVFACVTVFNSVPRLSRSALDDALL